MIDIYSTEFIIRVCIAALLGGVLGLEREIHGRPAGLRTHLLVSMGAAVFMMLSLYVTGMGTEVSGDPGRIAAQIVSGIGFLGAGAIVKEGVSIRGLTTAASLWVAAAIGMTAGIGSYEGAAVVSGLALFALVILPRIETIFKKHSYRILEVSTPLDVDISEILEVVKKQKVRVLRCDLKRDYERDTLKITMVIRIFHRGVTDKHAHGIMDAIEALNVPLKKIVWHPR